MASTTEDAAPSRREAALDKMAALWSVVEWSDAATFIGPNADRFKRVFDRTREAALARRSLMVRSFSWAALLFSFAWFFARKQWLFGGILLALPILIGYFLAVPSGAGIGIGVVITMMAKSTYLQASLPKIAKIVDAYPAGPGRDAALAAAGGISKLGAVGGGILLVLGIVALVMSK